MSNDKANINIKIKSNVSDEPFKIVPIKLQISKSVDGKIFIKDHTRFDIVIYPEEGRIITFPTEENDDVTFRAMERFLQHLCDEGIMERDFQGGDIYGSLEGFYSESEYEEQSSFQVLLYSIYKWMEKERPEFQFSVDLLKRRIKDMVNPPKEEETDVYAVKRAEDQARASKVTDKYGGVNGSAYNSYSMHYYQE